MTTAPNFDGHTLQLAPDEWALFVSTSHPADLQAAADDLNASAARALRQDDPRDAWAIFRAAGNRHIDVGACDSDVEWIFNPYMLERFGSAGHRFGEDFGREEARRDRLREAVTHAPRPKGRPMKVVKSDRATTGADWIVVRDTDALPLEVVSELIIKPLNHTSDLLRSLGPSPMTAAEAIEAVLDETDN